MGYATSMLDRQTQNEEIIVAHRCLNAGFGAHAYLLKDPKDFLSFRFVAKLLLNLVKCPKFQTHISSSIGYLATNLPTR